jgi:hypothetical protein
MNDSQNRVENAGLCLDNAPSNNIALGYKAGENITTEKLQFCIKLEGFDEVRTTMTQNEYEVMACLVKRLFGKAQK